MLGLVRRLFDLDVESPDIDIFDPFGLSVANESEIKKYIKKLWNGALARKVESGQAYNRF